jgi:hypothetical protein
MPHDGALTYGLINSQRLRPRGGLATGLTQNPFTYTNDEIALLRNGDIPCAFAITSAYFLTQQYLKIRKY